MSSNAVIRATSLGKCYEIYAQPRDRLLQMLFRNRRQYFREFWALRDVSFEIALGETVGVIGSNGSGKSTLLQLLCGTLTPTCGKVEVKGRVSALLELGAGFNPEFTGRENVYLNAAILGLTHDEIEKAFPDIEKFAEIGSFIDQPVKTYSSGMYVRLAFSVAVHSRPGILIVDEALSVGDARFQAKCLNRIKQMKEAGASILFVSHDINAVRSLCDRAIWLDAGRVRLIGDVFPVTAQYTEYMFSDAAEPPASDAAGDTAANRQEAHPINHWGTHTGAILSAGVFDAEGQRKNVFAEREAMQVRIRIDASSIRNRDALGVSFSFKDLRGDDLIVGSTWKNVAIELSDSASVFEVRFELENCLNTGDYLLVAALEDRSASTIQYYEYVEGAQYFSSLFQEIYPGRYMPRMSPSVTYANKEVLQ